MYDMRIRGIADAHRLARKRRCESSLPDGVVADAFPVCCGAIVVLRGCGDAGMRECGTGLGKLLPPEAVSFRIPASPHPLIPARDMDDRSMVRGRASGNSPVCCAR